MKKDLLEILVCPECKGVLELEALEADRSEVITGSLRCTACNLIYPINDGIPNLLPPELCSNA